MRPGTGRGLVDEPVAMMSFLPSMASPFTSTRLGDMNLARPSRWVTVSRESTTFT